MIPPKWLAADVCKTRFANEVIILQVAWPVYPNRKEEEECGAAKKIAMKDCVITFSQRKYCVAKTNREGNFEKV